MLNTRHDIVHCVAFVHVVNDLEKYLDPEYVDELSSVAAKTDAIIAGKLYLLMTLLLWLLW